MTRPPARTKRTPVKKEDATARSQDRLFLGTVDKALRVLWSFRFAQPSLTLSEIGRQADLDIFSVQRVTSTLVRLGLLSKDERRYRLTPKVLDLAYFYQRADGLADQATAYLVALGEETQENVNLTVLEGTDVIYIARMPRKSVRLAGGALGLRLPAYRTASGRAMLAALPREEAAAIIQRSNLEKVTPTTLVDPTALMREIDKARDQGFAMLVEEGMPGEISLASPVVNPQGRVVAAVSMPISSARWTPERARQQLAPLVMDAARSIGAFAR